MIFFVLGSHPELSAAEIEAVTGRVGRRAGEIYLLDDAGDSLPNLQNRLAGTIKIGSIVGSIQKWNKEEVATLIAAQIRISKSEFRIKSETRSSKSLFGISVYGHLRHHAEPIGLEVKKILKEDGVPCRLVTSREATLSSVVIAKNHLLTSGGEFVLIETKGGILIGQTETIQNFEAWSHRDFGRPARDAKSGMLPPKLARMMINLACGSLALDRLVLLDPFCGSGTVLMEAALTGFQEIIGSDISPKAVKDSEKNLRWLLDNEMRPRVMLSSAEELKTDEQVDVVVTEPFLGPPQRGGESRAQLQKLKADLAQLYQKSFVNIHTLMKPGGKLVVAWPIFRGESVMTKPLPGFTSQKRFVYERSGQRVGREICIYVRE